MASTAAAFNEADGGGNTGGGDAGGGGSGGCSLLLEPDSDPSGEDEVEDEDEDAGGSGGCSWLLEADSDPSFAAFASGACAREQPRARSQLSATVHTSGESSGHDAVRPWSVMARRRPDERIVACPRFIANAIQRPALYCACKRLRHVKIYGGGDAMAMVMIMVAMVVVMITATITVMAVVMIMKNAVASSSTTITATRLLRLDNPSSERSLRGCTVWTAPRAEVMVAIVVAMTVYEAAPFGQPLVRT